MWWSSKNGQFDDLARLGKSRLADPT
ncbi:MAG: cbb3-type cytochrome oxidase assembly protein CcoS [Hymenobacter sp.]|nr:MAG: cbb3-type cytochrome oxidase assembly protein CcoS [Hymenobacter sp.]